MVVNDSLIGRKVYYTGDMANGEDFGVVESIRKSERFTDTIAVRLDDGRLFKGVYLLAFDGGPGQRFYWIEDWLAKRAATIVVGQESWADLKARELI